MQRDDVASVVVLTMKSVLAPIQERLATLEARGADAAVLMAALGPLRERVTALETRPPLPGPPGKDGDAGKDGQDGAAGPSGSPGLEYRDVYQSGQLYQRGQCVTYAGSMWHCNTPTEARPGDGSAAWTLMVKRGRDAKGAP